MVDRLGAKPLPIQIPLGAEENFQGVIDLVKMKAIVWHGEQLGAKYDYVDIPAEYIEKAEEYRTQLIERVCEVDEELMNKYFEGEEISEEEIKHALRKGTIDLQFTPVLCGSSLKIKVFRLFLMRLWTISPHRSISHR